VTAIYQQRIGQQVSFNDLQQMVAEMQAAYRNEGLILVRVNLPPQEIDQGQGVVQIEIIEGQIEKVVFQEPLPEAVKPQIQRYVARVEGQDPVTYAEIDRFLILANTLPGMQAQATLVANPTVAGGSDLLMTTQQTKVSGFVNFNSRGTRYVGPNQLSVGASVYDVFGADALSMVAATTPDHPNQMGYANINYGIVIGPQATKINASYTTTHTRPGDSLSNLEMKGGSSRYMLSIDQPLLVSTPQKVSLFSSLTHLDSNNNVFTDQQLYNDSISMLAIGLAYQGIFWQSYNDVNISVTKGLPILGAPRTLSNPSVLEASTDFVRLNAESSHVHYFSPQASVALATQFQFTNDRLISSERINYGGPVFGQAFDPDVIRGDSGAFASLALRYDLPKPDWLSLLQADVFYDAGTVHVNNAMEGEQSSATGQSAGIGLNANVDKKWSAGITLAHPLHLTNSVGVNMGWRTFFNVTGVF
jgi:hemolysin activation/secretion protein